MTLIKELMDWLGNSRTPRMISYKVVMDKIQELAKKDLEEADTNILKLELTEKFIEDLEKVVIYGKKC